MASSTKFNTAGAGTTMNNSPRPTMAAAKTASWASCGCCASETLEYLDYDYTYDDVSAGSKSRKPPQPYPRIRERGEYYIDTFNDQPWACTFGTGEHVRLRCISFIMLCYWFT